MTSESPFFFDGKLWEATTGPAAWSELHAAMVHGEGLYETIRIEEGEPLFLDRHLARLASGAEFLELQLPESLSESQCRSSFEKLLALQGLSDAGVRIVLLRRGNYDEDTSRGQASSFVSVSPLSAAAGPFEDRVPSRLWTWRAARHPGPPTGAHKFLGRFFFALSKREARRAGADEALLLDARGHVAETSFGNLFWVRDRRIFTPTLDLGILPGVTRSVILELASAMGLEIEETSAPLVSVLSAAEVFVTSSLREIQPVASVDGAPTREAAPGAITRAIRDALTARKFDTKRGAPKKGGILPQ